MHACMHTYIPNFFRRSLWNGKLVKMFLLLCKCIFNFSLQLIFKSSIAFMDSYGYKFYAVCFCSLSFSSTFPGVWTYVKVEWVRWRLFLFLTLLKFHWQNDNKKLNHKIQRYNNAADEVKCWTSEGVQSLWIECCKLFYA